MENIDQFSYRCGVIDSFNEIIHGGIKKLAMSHPEGTQKERDRYLEFAAEMCRKYNTHFYPEDSPILTDLFPISINRGTFNIIFYQHTTDLNQYLDLKQRKQKLIEAGEYRDEARVKIAVELGQLLSYTQEAIMQMIEKNKEKEMLWQSFLEKRGSQPVKK